MPDDANRCEKTKQTVRARTSCSVACWTAVCGSRAGAGGQTRHNCGRSQIL